MAWRQSGAVHRKCTGSACWARPEHAPACTALGFQHSARQSVNVRPPICRSWLRVRFGASDAAFFFAASLLNSIVVNVIVSVSTCGVT